MAIAACLAASAVAGAARPASSSSNSAQAGACQLGDRGKIKHVIYLQFDNVHFNRDNPNVPSDLEQMPNLLNFIRNNGTLDTNDHTVLISHTGGGILSSLTGLYPDRHGQNVSNAYGYFRPDGSVETAATPVANNVGLLVEAVVLNYLALHNRVGDFASVLPMNGLGGAVDALTAFAPIR